MSHTTTELMGFFYGMRVCSKCKEEKELNEFTKDASSKDGIRCSCKKCNALYKKLYVQNNTEKIKAYKENNKDKYKEYSKKYRNNNKNKIQDYQKEYRENNKENTKERSKKYFLENREKIYNYRLKNIKKYIGYNSKWIKKKIKEDSVYKFKYRVRALIVKSFKRGRKHFIKSIRTEEILGCNSKEFVDYISSKFTEGMSIHNHGEWHLDHIIPISSAKTEEEVIKLNHYTNFQPLWAEDNFKKGNKY